MRRFYQEILPDLATLMLKAEELIPEAGKLISKKILPYPRNPTPINGGFIGKLLFLRFTPVTLQWLVSQLQDKQGKTVALQNIATRTAAQQRELNRLASTVADVRSRRLDEPSRTAYDPPDSCAMTSLRR